MKNGISFLLLSGIFGSVFACGGQVVVGSSSPEPDASEAVIDSGVKSDATTGGLCGGLDEQICMGTRECIATYNAMCNCTCPSAPTEKGCDGCPASCFTYNSCANDSASLGQCGGKSSIPCSGGRECIEGTGPDDYGKCFEKGLHACGSETCQLDQYCFLEQGGAFLSGTPHCKNIPAACEGKACGCLIMPGAQNTCACTEPNATTSLQHVTCSYP